MASRCDQVLTWWCLGLIGRADSVDMVMDIAAHAGPYECTEGSPIYIAKNPTKAVWRLRSVPRRDRRFLSEIKSIRQGAASTHEGLPTGRRAARLGTVISFAMADNNMVPGNDAQNEKLMASRHSKARIFFGQQAHVTYQIW